MNIFSMSELLPRIVGCALGYLLTKLFPVLNELKLWWTKTCNANRFVAIYLLCLALGLLLISTLLTDSFIRSMACSMLPILCCGCAIILS